MQCNGVAGITQLMVDCAGELLPALRRTADSCGKQLYLVGGTVRDYLLGRNSHDLDLAVRGDCTKVAKTLLRELGEGSLVDLSTAEEQTLRIVWRREQIDISAFRMGVETIEEDLRLRDFTINAMAIDLADCGAAKSNWSLIDPLGGLDDLRQGRIRHCPGAFVADPLRMLRGYRLQAVMDLHLEAATTEEIGRQAPLIDRVAAERINYELQLIFSSTATASTLREMGDAGLLRLLLPEFCRAEGVEQPEFHHLDVFGHSLLALQMMESILAAPERFFPAEGRRIRNFLEEENAARCLKWAALMHDIGKPVTRAVRPADGRITFYGHDEVGRELFRQFAERAKWSRSDTEMVGSLISMHMHPFHLCNVQRDETISKRAALKLCRRAGKWLIALFLLAMADSLASSGEKKPERMEEELAVLFAAILKIYDENIEPVLHGPRLMTGNDLIAEFNLSPGPLFSEILQELEAARVEGTVVDRSSAFVWVAEFLRKQNG